MDISSSMQPRHCGGHHIGFIIPLASLYKWLVSSKGSVHLQLVPMLMGNCLLLFLWCLLDKSFVSPLHSSTQSRMAKEHHRNLMAHRKHGMMGAHRVKRGWVWNQFFVLEEYMGSDPQYVGKVRCYRFLKPML